MTMIKIYFLSKFQLVITPLKYDHSGMRGSLV